MDPITEQRITELLRHAATASVPLRRLHGRLASEPGVQVGTYARFAEEIQRSRAFVVLDRDDPLGDGRDWPPGLRGDYETQLAAAGLDTGPVLTLAPPALVSVQPGISGDDGGAAPGAATIALVYASLLDFWETAADDETARGVIGAALTQLGDLRQALRE
jgi:hypothetical protein